SREDSFCGALRQNDSETLLPRGGFQMFRMLSTILGIALVVAACGENMQTASLKTPPPAPPPPIRMWMVFFDTNSTALSEQANMTVSAAAAIAKSGPTRVEVSGFTDTEGNVAYNQALSVRRAAA